MRHSVKVMLISHIEVLFAWTLLSGCRMGSDSARVYIAEPSHTEAQLYFPIYQCVFDPEGISDDDPATFYTRRLVQADCFVCIENLGKSSLYLWPDESVAGYENLQFWRKLSSGKQEELIRYPGKWHRFLPTLIEIPAKGTLLIPMSFSSRYWKEPYFRECPENSETEIKVRLQRIYHAAGPDSLNLTAIRDLESPFCKVKIKGDRAFDALRFLHNSQSSSRNGAIPEDNSNGE